MDFYNLISHFSFDQGFKYVSNIIDSVLTHLKTSNFVKNAGLYVIFSTLLLMFTKHCLLCLIIYNTIKMRILLTDSKTNAGLYIVVSLFISRLCRKYKKNHTDQNEN